jgi:hypothetical protein
MFTSVKDLIFATRFILTLLTPTLSTFVPNFFDLIT